MKSEIVDYSKFTKEKLINEIKKLSELLNIDTDDSTAHTSRAINIGQWQWDIANNKVTFDEKKIDTLGYSMSEIPTEIGLEFFTDKIHPDDHKMVMDNMKDHLSGKSDVYEVEYKIQTKNGKYKWFFDQGIVVEHDLKGNPILLSGIVFDITKRKTLEKTNKLLAKLPYENPDVVLIMDTNGETIFINPTGEKRIKKDTFEILPDEFVASLKKTYNNQGQSVSRFALGENHYLLKIKSLDGENKCMVTISDITDIIKAKEDRNLYYRALQSVKQAMFMTDKNGKITKINEEFERLYGYSKSEVLGKNPKLLNAGKETYLNLGYSEEEYDALFKDMWQSITDVNLGTWEGTVINRSKSGKVMWVKLVINAIYNSNHEISNFFSLPIDMTSSITNTKNAKRELYKAIAELAELRDNETGAHMRRVGIYSKLIAKALNLPNSSCDELEFFAPMHDIGKVGIPDSILLAPRKLTKEEFSIMKMHTIYGYNIVKEHKDMELVSEITLGHHEKFDGSGYPYGKSGEDIPISARIVALTDVYDALRSVRPYKTSWTHEEAIKHITDNKGKHFDPQIVEVFLKLSKQFEKIFDEISDDLDRDVKNDEKK